MMILADYNLNRQALLLSGSLVAGGWLDIAPIRLVTFQDIGLASNSDDRVVWRLAQSNQMLLLKARLTGREFQILFCVINSVQLLIARAGRS